MRLALSDDADAIGRIQVDAWRAAYADLVPSGVLAELPADAFAARWRESINRPREARQRVLVALDGLWVRGFAATTPGTDPDADPATDGEVVEFAVDVAHRRRGHGSRLLHAVADTMRADQFRRATIWVAGADAAFRGFLTTQGWATDGAKRALALDGEGTVLEQLRLHTDLQQL